jgi:hypothetical protein
MSLSFQRMATVAFSTKRQPAITGGKRGAPALHLVGDHLRCTPLDPADPGGKGEFVARLITEATTQLLETMVDAELDIRAGDLLVARGREYPIKACGRWEWRGSEFLYLIVEDLQR